MEELVIITPCTRGYYTETVCREQSRTEFESGAVQSRPRWSRPRYRYTFGWKALPDNEYLYLQDFFGRNSGCVFLITDLHGRAVPVRFTQSSLPQGKVVSDTRNEGLFWDTGAIPMEEK